MAKLLVFSLLIAVVGVAIYLGCYRCSGKVDLDKYRRDGYFGAKPLKDNESPPADSTSIRPFKVNVSEAELQDLKSRLDRARFTDHIEGTAFEYGFSAKSLKKIVHYWRTQYDWRAAETKLNQYDQFHTQIEGIDVHFVRARPTDKRVKVVVPLLVAHGWPGSVLEYYKTFPLFTEPDQDGLAFEVIAPSIPGFAYSEAPHKSGLNVAAVARIYVKLIKRLGHDRFVIHGGDWGNLITRAIALIYPENVLTAHIIGNFDTFNIASSPKQFIKTIFAAALPSLFFGTTDYQKEYSKLFPLKNFVLFSLQESGYFHIQATKPDTVGAALVDSPVGLAAWILEKFSTGTNPIYRTREDGGITEKFTLDELLTNVMIYWTSGNVAASLRFYRENVFFGELRYDLPKVQITVPAGTVDTPHEIVRTPRALMEYNYANLVQYTEFPRGGHFIAMEEPKFVADDLRSLVHKVRKQQQQQQKQNQPNTE